jgi:lipoprotein-anchoring transpeptidase ErfK/SrfK
MSYLRFLAILAIVKTEAFSAERRIIISLADHKLAFIEDGRIVKIYPVAVGKAGTPSPTGTFEVISRVSKPTWYGPHQIVAAGPRNPLGTRWMGLSHKGYGIHGTNAPLSIGKSASHGCIRMRKQDVEELFELVHVGDKVELMKQPAGDLARVFASTDASEKMALASNTSENLAGAPHTISGGGQ